MTRNKKSVIAGNKTLVRILRNWRLYFLLLVPIAWLAIFRYIPMVGISMAFTDYSIRRGLLGSKLVGFKYFAMFLNGANFKMLLTNTLYLSIYSLVAGFPIPIILAFALNECRNLKARKFIQTVTFMPFFVSMIVLISIFSQIFHVHFGMVNVFLRSLGMQPLNIIGTAPAFRHMYVWSGVWQSAGYNAVLYIAALSAIDPELKEAATIDGASRFQKVCHIDFPGITPTIIITLILALGGVMSVGFEKAYIMQTPANLFNSEIISTYVYKVGIQGSQFSFAAAIGVFNSVINFVLIVFFNAVSKRVGENSLW